MNSRIEIKDNELEAISGGVISYESDSLHIYGEVKSYQYANGHTKEECEALHRSLVGYSDEAAIQEMLRQGYITE